MLDCAFSPSLRVVLAGLCCRPSVNTIKQSLSLLMAEIRRVGWSRAAVYKFACAEIFFLFLFSPVDEENSPCELMDEDRGRCIMLQSLSAMSTIDKIPLA